jgi:hypothetical protein
MGGDEADGAALLIVCERSGCQTSRVRGGLDEAITVGAGGSGVQKNGERVDRWVSKGRRQPAAERGQHRWASTTH